ncbi:flavin monoamine oxidase family protein [Flammeovirga agarivorans]|uniref:Tryptophan 2-monooxygenase n=1 Tax=Flammeovirga agarivorans TaxID=2726742 RepID=A0A7X8SKI5_9BACT|nr:FAD-dependent oxidoreductase [Flammeovirga agarivorans]NLR91896.1 NAD(P)-binding protein [Flammeovirga agarivorans]
MESNITYPHVPIQEQIDNIIAASAKSGKKKVTIIGAGVAGLASAYELLNLGHEVEVLEASDRIGGRIYTYRFDEENPDENYGELGAMRVPQSHDYTHYYLDKMGCELRRFVTIFENDNAYAYCRQKKSRIKNIHDDLLPRYDLTTYQKLESNQPPAKLFGAALNHLISLLTDQEVEDLFNGKITTDRLREYDNTSLGEFINEICVGEDANELVGNFIGLDGWRDKAITMFIRDNIVDTDDGLKEVVGGMGKLTDGLFKEVSPNVRLKTVVKSIDNKEDKVIIGLHNEFGKYEEIHADYVLCTIPFSVLRNMSVRGISFGKQRAIREMKYAAATKTAIYCKERFWETKDGIYGGASLSDEITRWTYYPSDHVKTENNIDKNLRVKGFGGMAMHPHEVKGDTPSGKDGVMLASYVLGEDANRLAALDEEKRHEVVVDKVSLFHPELKEEGMIKDTASIAWSTHEWSAGAFAFLWPGQLEHLWADVLKPEGRLFFAGEHCSTDQAWIQGSLISSLRETQNILEYGVDQEEVNEKGELRASKA